MEDFIKIFYGNLIVIQINLTRATTKEAIDLKKLLDDEIVFNHLKLVIDLCQCEYINSTFLGVLVSELKRVSARGGELMLVRPADSAMEFMYRAKCDEIFNIYNSREEAVNSFG